jgi:hypothetical protein
MAKFVITYSADKDWEPETKSWTITVPERVEEIEAARFEVISGYPVFFDLQGPIYTISGDWKSIRRMDA